MDEDDSQNVFKNYPEKATWIFTLKNMCRQLNCSNSKKYFSGSPAARAVLQQSFVGWLWFVNNELILSPPQ